MRNPFQHEDLPNASRYCNKPPLQQLVQLHSDHFLLNRAIHSDLVELRNESKGWHKGSSRVFVDILVRSIRHHERGESEYRREGKKEEREK